MKLDWGVDVFLLFIFKIKPPYTLPYTQGGGGGGGTATTKVVTTIIRTP